MNRTLSNVLLFATGAVVGSVATWKFFKSKYEIVDEDFGEEIDEEEGESEEEDEPRPSNEDADDIAKVKASLNKKPPLREYVEMVNRFGYSAEEAPDDEEEKDVYEPYIIRPDEYGEIHSYEQLSLNYYADGVLTDELDNRIEDVESIVPADFAEHFGEYEDHAVHVRNDERQCDYEILRDLRTFADAVGDDLYPSEDE